MQIILDDLYNSKKILDHGMVVGKELAYVLSGGDTNLNNEISEDQMYKLELSCGNCEFYTKYLDIIR